MRCVDMTGSGKRWFVVVALGLMVPSLGFGKIIYVDDDAIIGGDGRSWDKAFRFLQDGIAVSEPNDEIRVAQGTYVPDCNETFSEGSGDRDASFHLVAFTHLRGGYAGI